MPNWVFSLWRRRRSIFSFEFPSQFFMSLGRPIFSWHFFLWLAGPEGFFLSCGSRTSQAASISRSCRAFGMSGTSWAPQMRRFFLTGQKKTIGQKEDHWSKNNGWGQIDEIPLGRWPARPWPGQARHQYKGISSNWPKASPGQN